MPAHVVGQGHTKVFRTRVTVPSVHPEAGMAGPSTCTLLLNHDWGHEEAAAPGNEAALWQGFAAVANYAFTDRASAAVGGEWFDRWL